MVNVDWNLIATLTVMTGTLLATLYRIKIEKKQVQVVAENAEYRKTIELFKLMMEKEKDEFLKMTPEEVYDMLQKVLCSE